MEKPKQQLQAYLDRIKFNIIYLNSILKQVNMIYDWIDQNNHESVKAGDHFYGTFIYTSKRILTIELCKLLLDREDRSLTDWLSKAHTHAKSLKPIKKVTFEGDKVLYDVEEYREVIDKHKDELDSHSSTVKNLNKLRDQGFAHSDKKYFENPKQLNIDYEVTWSEFNNLFQTINKIIREHHNSIFGTDISLELVTTGHVDNVLKHTRASKRLHKNEKLREMRLKIYSFFIDDYDPDDIFLPQF